jgi:uncharacterized membrane protein YphA (DoxX/SURF4 family)
VLESQCGGRLSGPQPQLTPAPARLPAGAAACLGHTELMRLAAFKRAVVAAPDARLRTQGTATNVAIVSGVIFFFAGLVKFVFHHWELNAFHSFGLPVPSLLEIVAGVVEMAGGVLLVMRRWLVPVGVALSVTMVVAIWSSGILNGDVIPSLTLAPALLIAMLYLLDRALRGSTPSAPST